jgi:hypothetical protein
MSYVEGITRMGLYPEGWASSVDNTKVREQMVQLRAELEHLALCKEAAERQLV